MGERMGLEAHDTLSGKFDSSYWTHPLPSHTHTHACAPMHTCVLAHTHTHVHIYQKKLLREIRLSIIKCRTLTAS